MIDKNDRLKVPKRLYIMDYQLEPCKIDGISSARLYTFPFNTTNGKLIEYLCLDTLWHPASEEPREFAEVLAEAKITESIKTYISFKRNDSLFKNWDAYSSGANITQWLYIDDLLPKKGD